MLHRLPRLQSGHGQWRHRQRLARARVADEVVMRYFLLDQITSFVPNESATGIKNVSLTDQVLHDHFPDYPILPGALIVEAMAQLSGFLLESGDPAAPERAILAQIEKAKFHA